MVGVKECEHKLTSISFFANVHVAPSSAVNRSRLQLLASRGEPTISLLCDIYHLSEARMFALRLQFAQLSFHILVISVSKFGRERIFRARHFTLHAKYRLNTGVEASNTVTRNKLHSCLTSFRSLHPSWTSPFGCGVKADSTERNSQMANGP